MAESDQITVTASDFQQEASASELAEVEDRARPYLNQEPPDALEQKALDLHNAARTKRGTKELVWDAGLTYEAYQWALELVRVDHMKHRGNNKIENIASMTAAPPNPYEKATQLWLAEETNYRAAPSDKAGYQAWRSDWNKWKDAGHYGKQYLAASIRDQSAVDFAYSCEL